MCELLAISSDLPVDVKFSLAEFAEHGGKTAPHRDGWGIAYYEGRDVRRIRGTEAASNSDWVDFIEHHDLRSQIVISHIRNATVGNRILSNTQPFSRELCGRVHVFAHNGDIPDIFTKTRFQLNRFIPIGDTDSEHAFCFLMDRMETIWRTSLGPPLLPARMEIIAQFARDLRTLGSANFLYSDGDLLFVHAHRRRSAPISEYVTGLYFLCRSCHPELPEKFSTSGLSVVRTPKSPEAIQHVALVASVPLSNENWSPLSEGEIIAVKNGIVVARQQS